MTSSEILDNYFISKTLRVDVNAAIEDYLYDRTRKYFSNNIDGFVSLLPYFSSWVNHNAEKIKIACNPISLYKEEVIPYLAKYASISSGLNEAKFKVGKLKRDHLKRIHFAIKHNDVRVVKHIKSINVKQLLEDFLEAEISKVADRIDDDSLLRVDELQSVRNLKKLDILRKVWLVIDGQINFFDDHDKVKYLLELKSRYSKIILGDTNAWSTVLTAFSRTQLLIGSGLTLPNNPVLTYDFSEYNNLPFIIYCKEVIEGKEHLAMVAHQLTQGIGTTWSDKDRKKINKVATNRPAWMREATSHVLNEFLFKYSKFVSVTSLISALDPIIKFISSELNSRGLTIAIHAFNIGNTYSKFKHAYLNSSNPYPNFSRLFLLLDQLFSKNGGSIRNSILHLDGVDFTSPENQFNLLKDFIYNVYFEISRLLLHENISITALPSSYNSLDVSDIGVIVANQNAFNDYVTTKVIMPKIMTFASGLVESWNANALWFFKSRVIDQDILINNWDQIYSGPDENKGYSLEALLSIKKHFNEPSIQASHGVEPTSNELVEGLKLINTEELIEYVRNAASPEIDQMLERLNNILPAFTHLAKIVKFSVRTTNVDEAILVIVMSSILIEKLLLHLKMHFNQANLLNCKCNNGNYYCTFKNMEIANPAPASFIDVQFLEDLYRHVNATNQLDQPGFDEFKKLLVVYEKIRNISAHGGFDQFRSHFMEINQFLYFLTFRLIGLH